MLADLVLIKIKYSKRFLRTYRIIPIFAAFKSLKHKENMIETIGMNAGLVWNALNDGGQMSVKALKKATKIKTEKDVYAALGWLAKEGKLAFSEKGADLLVSLL